MSLSESELQNYVGRNKDEVTQELENQGYKVHDVRIGTHATGYVPAARAGDAPVKRAIIVYDGDDSEQRVT
ncbi:unnamed protein product, partial [Didymodactylos carnosus]